MSKTAASSLSNRILTFDLLRGYFLLVILLNHLNFYPNGLGWLTGESILYVSTAEGFFVVSGIVLGIIRGRKLLDKPFMVGAKLLWKRALQLYVASIVLTVLFTLIGQFFLGNPGLKYGIFTDWNHWWNFIWQTLTFGYTYGWADFLKYYALFLAFTPLALWLLRKGYWYIVLALSFMVWCLFPLSPFPPEFSQPISWQIIFFGGFIIGFYWEALLAKWRTLSLSRRKAIRTSLVVTFIVTAIATFTLVFGHYLGGALGAHIDAIHHIVEQGFNKDRLPIPRILLGIIWFWALFAIFRRHEAWLTKRLGWILLSFGSNSLYVYTISAVVVFFIHLLIAPPGFGVLLFNLAASIVAIGIVLLAVRTKFLMRIIPR
jgi:hypothetical protein